MIPLRELRRMLKRQFWRAQQGRCPICSHRLSRHWSRHRLSFDHVWPRSKVGEYAHEGNVLLVHPQCNKAKASRRPTGCELLILFVVNRALDFSEPETRAWDAPWRELAA